MKEEAYIQEELNRLKEGTLSGHAGLVDFAKWCVKISYGWRNAYYSKGVKAYAAQAAFYIILSFIPFLMSFMSVLRFTSISMDMVIDTFENFVPAYVVSICEPLIEETYESTWTQFGVSLFVGVWSAAKSLQCMTEGFNKIYSIRETRSWLTVRLRCTVDMLFFMVSIVITLVLLVFGEDVNAKLATLSVPLAAILQRLIDLRGLLIFAVTILVIMLMYIGLPNRAKRKRQSKLEKQKAFRERLNKRFSNTKAMGLYSKLVLEGKMEAWDAQDEGLSKKFILVCQLPGALIAALAMYVISFGMSILVTYFGAFSIYGNMATVVLVMFWLNACTYMIMVCALFNHMYSEKVVEYIIKRIRTRQALKMEKNKE